MSGGAPSRSAMRGVLALSLLATMLFVLATPGFVVAQVHGVPPSVTSIQFHVPPFLPNAMPSVTSLGPNGFGYRAGPTPPPYGIYPNRPVYGRGRRSVYGFTGYSFAYAVPYVVPVYDASYGSDSGGGGPYLYSSPAAEQTLHIVIDMPPPRGVADDDNAGTSEITVNSKLAHDARPIDPTVLVFRDGHQQEVTNYAIMGQTLYIFDTRTQKIGLGDLDVSATVALNDDRGVEFHLPAPR